MVKQAKDYIGFDVNFPNDFLRETEYIISLSLDSKEVREGLNGNGNNEPKLDKIATNYEKTDGFQFYQNQLNCAVWCASTGCRVGMKQQL